MKYSFENLDVWQDTRRFTKSIYSITSNFPDEERFGLISQMRRAAVSVLSNIAEGSARWGKRDQARFYEISFGSLTEVLTQLILSGNIPQSV